MKVHTMLQALAKQQAYRGDLRVYVKDSVFGTWKADNTEILPLITWS